MIRKTLTLILLLIIPMPGFLKVVVAHDDGPRLRAVVSFTVADFQPAMEHRTGPINWIARNPRNPSEVFASSVSGGLWRSTDERNNWRPVRSLQPWSVSAVAYLFDGTPEGAVLGTTRGDFRINSGAGVWRSNDRGASWTQVAQVSPGCGDQLNAYGIAVRDTTVYAATSCGVLRSSDGLNFSKVPVSEFSPAGVLSGSEKFYSVEFSPSGALLLGGESGFFRQFRAASAPPELPLRMSGDGAMQRAFAVSPSHRYPNVVLALSGNRGRHTMTISQDDGRTWRRVASSASGPGEGAGGSPFVRIIPSSAGSTNLFVYYGDSLRWLRAGPFRDGDLSSLATDAGLRWPTLTIGHPDPHDVDFVNLTGDPLDHRTMLLATDGGLEICNFGAEPEGVPMCSESQVLETNHGLSPIQVMNVKGQIIGSGYSAVRRLYMNTWHTDAWASPNNGKTWIRGGGEAAWLEMERQIANPGEAQIVYNNNPRPNMLGKDLRADPIEFIDAPNVSSPPVLLQPTIFSENGSAGDTTSLYVAEDVTQESMPGIRWVPRLRYETCRAPGDCDPLWTSAAGVLAGYLEPSRLHAVLYQPYGDKLAVVRLGFIRARGRLALRTANVNYSRMDWAGHEVKLGFAYTPLAGFGAYPVLGADPSFPLHVLIPDINNNSVMQSIDGGDTWTSIAGLTEAVTRDSRESRGPRIFEFRRRVDGNFQSMVSAISFFPEDPNLVMLGTVENGLFFSQDRGTTWQHVPNTEHITNALSLYWRSANSVIVGSWGRGLFEITLRYRLPRSILDSICSGCAYTPISRFGFERFIPAVAQTDSVLQQQTFDSAVLILNGRISGVEMKQDQVQKVWTTIGSSEYRFAGFNEKFQFETKEHTGLIGFKGLPAAEQLVSQDKVVKGLGFTSGRLTHIIYGSQETLIPRPSPLGPVSFPKETDPHLKNPYLRIFGPGMILGAIAGGKSFDLQGYLFQANTPIELQVDGRVTEQLRTDAKGRFATRLVAPSSIGPHLIVASQSFRARTVRAVIGFSVSNSDTR